jgi:hypothetical protein
MTTTRFLRLSLAVLWLSVPVSAGLYFNPVPAPEGADTSALAADGATLWAGTYRGVWKLQSGIWSLDGLSDKSVSSLAVFGGAVRAATGDGLWKRGADGTWSLETLPGDPSILSALAMDGSALYAGGTGAFRYAGGSWTELAPAGGIVSSLAVFQGDLVAGVVGHGAVRYPGTTGSPVAMSAGFGVSEGAQAFAAFGGVLHAGTYRGVYSWNGYSWVADAAYGLHDVRALASASGDLWAASADGGVSRKSGSSWSAANEGLLFASAKSFALLGTDLYVGTAGAPVYRFSGGSWSPAGTGLAAAVISDLYFFGLAEGTVVATRGAGMLQASDTHPEVFNIPSGCGDVRAVAIVGTAPIREGIFLAATNCGPYQVSGSNASLANSGLPNGAVLTSLQSIYAPPVGAFAGTTNAGIWRYSSPSWTQDTEGIPSTASISALRQVGNDVFAAAGLGVLRRGADGTWSDESAGLPFGATVFSFGGPSAPGSSVFAGLAAGGVYRLDPGPIWRQDTAGLPAAPVHSLEAVGTRLYAAAGTGGLYRKAGGAWLREGAGLPAGTDVRVVRYGGISTSGTDRILAGTAGSGLFGSDAGAGVKTIPVVLDVPGAGSGGFRTELTLGNRGTTPLDVALTFLAASEFGAPAAGTATVTIPAETEIRAADALSFLRGLGMPIPVATPGAPVGGSLSMSAGSGTNGLYGFARSYTSGSPGGTYGVFLDATSDLDAAEDEAYVYGLRSLSGIARSNLAVTHVPGRGSDAISVEVQVWDADGNAAPTLLTRTLAPGEWYQWNGVLQKAGLGDGSYGYARIRRVSGIGPFIAYGVVNDALTSDGSVLSMVRPGGVSAARKLVVPVVVDTSGEAGSHFTTELTLANDGPIGTPVDLVYHPAPGFGSAGGVPLVTLNLAARHQTTIPDILQYLRDHGVSIPEQSVGTLGVTFRSLQNLDTPRTVAFARTSTPNPDVAAGGTFGVAYPAIPFGGGARTWAVVPGLAQSAAVRSNLAVVHTGGGSGGPVTLAVSLFDAATGLPVGTGLSRTLYPGDWYQWSRVAEKAGVPPGTGVYAVVTRASGDDTFLAYGVANDAVTSDGSWIAMIPAEEY